jgi:hypothetical protein
MAGGAVELTWCLFEVSMLETIVNKSGRVVEADVVTLTEAFMNELIKLDADDNVKAQRRIREKCVQKHVEPLDAICAQSPLSLYNKIIDHVVIRFLTIFS